MNYLQAHKYRAAAVISVAVHILALYLLSFWVVDSGKNEAHELDNVIVNVRLVTPEKTKPLPRPPAEESANIIEREAPFSPLPVKYNSAYDAPVKQPAPLSSFAKMKMAQPYSASPIKPHLDISGNAVGRQAQEPADSSWVKPTDINATAKIKPIKAAVMGGNKKALLMSTANLVKKGATAKTIPIKYSARISVANISSAVVSDTTNAKKWTSRRDIGEMPMAPNGLSATHTVDAAVKVNFPARNWRPNNAIPARAATATQNFSGKSPAQVANFMDYAMARPTASPVQPAANNLAGPISMATAAMDYGPRSHGQGRSVVAMAHPAHNHAKAMSPIGTVELTAYSNSVALQRNWITPISALNSANPDYISPVYMTAFQQKRSSVYSSKPAIMASLPHKTINKNNSDAAAMIELKSLRRDFTKRVRERIALVKKYPNIARRRGFEGQPVVAFTIGRDGALTKHSIATSSGHRVLDRSALESVKKAAPYPRIPDKLELQSINLKLPISYILK